MLQNLYYLKLFVLTLLTLGFGAEKSTAATFAERLRSQDAKERAEAIASLPTAKGAEAWAMYLVASEWLLDFGEHGSKESSLKALQEIAAVEASLTKLLINSKDTFIEMTATIIKGYLRGKPVRESQIKIHEQAIPHHIESFKKLAFSKTMDVDFRIYALSALIAFGGPMSKKTSAQFKKFLERGDELDPRSLERLFNNPVVGTDKKSLKLKNQWITNMTDIVENEGASLWRASVAALLRTYELIEETSLNLKKPPYHRLRILYRFTAELTGCLRSNKSFAIREGVYNELDDTVIELRRISNEVLSTLASRGRSVDRVTFDDGLLYAETGTKQVSNKGPSFGSLFACEKLFRI